MSARARTSGVTSSSCWSKSIFGPWVIQLSRTLHVLFFVIIVEFAFLFVEFIMYHSEVCVIGWIHQEVDYNMQTLIFVEPKDHLKRLHLKQKF